MCDKFKPCEALGLMSHLKTKGGVNKEKVNRKKEITSMGCPFHYGTRMFLECLYKDYHGGKSVPDGYDSQRLSYHFNN